MDRSRLAYKLPSKTRIEWKIRGIEVTGGQGRRLKQILDDFEEERRYWEEVLDRTVWKTCFGRRNGPVVKLTLHLGLSRAISDDTTHS